MREILFRGKQITDKTWVAGGVYTDIDGKLYIIRRAKYRPEMNDWYTDLMYESNPDCPKAMIEIIPETLGQYTGLTDANGVKIFEGDIIEHSWGWRDDAKCIVRWEHTSCGFEPFSDSLENCGHCGGGVRPDFCKVIDNIYDNPSLAESLINKRTSKDVADAIQIFKERKGVTSNG